MISAIAIDDELPALKVIEFFCDKVDFIDLQKTFNKPTEALKYIKKFPVDLVFLDINMPSLNGIDFYKSVQQNTMAIFTTAYSEYAVEGFNLSAVDYLLKPFTFERFELAVNKAHDFYNYQHQRSANANQFLFIRADYSLIKIAINDILYIEGLDDYLKIHQVSGKPLVARMTFKSLLEKLPATGFARVHRSFVVSKDKIESIRNKTIHIKDAEIPVGSSYEENLSKLLNQ
ncbi:DNA-binding response regulator [Solitalea longa]|uniref:DNA-binding response regulator n=1 Tax=Solitalea longa TaxID=2079460 RepID=A0A2S4ZZJ6_9SPHI|nr:LytTR family DNA-binding domain-containing protein [Solitalea longa]POY35293.1 DNA-binding response regulator [Solitalea longa]